MPQATRPAFINCARCGAEKVVGERGPIPTYCSAICRAALKYERSLQDGRYQRELEAGRERTRERLKKNARPCPYCRALMTHPRRVQCGAAECRRRFNADRMAEWQRDYKAAAGKWYQRNYMEQQRDYYRRCSLAGTHWRQRFPGRAAAADARRRALVQQARTAETFAPIDVHTRDQWMCQLCWLPIDPGVAWPDSMSASIDHVIPLSKGGAHAMANVQSAHLGCNCSKGDRLLTQVIEVLRTKVED